MLSSLNALCVGQRREQPGLTMKSNWRVPPLSPLRRARAQCANLWPAFVLLSCQSGGATAPEPPPPSVSSVNTKASFESPPSAGDGPAPDAIASDGRRPKFAPGECGRAKRDNYVWMIARIEDDKYVAHGWVQCGWGDPASMSIDTIDSLYLEIECPSVADCQR